jgi:hypothetical protein
LGRLHMHTAQHMRACVCICSEWVSWWARRLLVVTGARCPLTKPVVAAVELQAAIEPQQPQPRRAAWRYLRARWCSASRNQAGPRGSGAGLARRPQVLPAPLPLLGTLADALVVSRPNCRRKPLSQGVGSCASVLATSLAGIRQRKACLSRKKRSKDATVRG